MGDLKCDVVESLARKKVTGGHNKTVDTVKNWFKSSDQGKAEDAIRELIRDPESPVERYGGQRDAIRLTSLQDARQWLLDNCSRDLWWLD